ncbi:MAG: ATP-dependent Clp protease adapter ClpS [Aliivibrio sp.]|nr:ATP-dependent Clp protease adapter ClpS [Aliivibrio sp.]
MPSPTTVAKPTSDTSTKHYPNWCVIVLNDDHNTFEHVTSCFVMILPNMTPETAWGLAERIHNEGVATVWTGPLEQAEMYHQQLGVKGLTMSPLRPE